MKKNNLVSFISIIVVGLFIITASAIADWEQPKQGPDECDKNPYNLDEKPNPDYDPACLQPLHVGYEGQYKFGGLFIANAQPDGNIGFVVVNGNTGLGVPTPSEKLEVAGNILASGDICTDVGVGGIICLGGTGDVPVGFWDQNGAHISNINTGNVGVGTTTPGRDFAVEGTILASEDVCYDLGGGLGSKCLSDAGTGLGFWTDDGDDIQNINDGNVNISGDLKIDNAGEFYTIQTAGGSLHFINDAGDPPNLTIGRDGGIVLSNYYKRTSVQCLHVDIDGALMPVECSALLDGDAPSDGDWTIVDPNIYRLGGNVGIGTDDPTSPLDVFGDIHIGSQPGADSFSLVIGSAIHDEYSSFERCENPLQKCVSDNTPSGSDINSYECSTQTVGGPYTDLAQELVSSENPVPTDYYQHRTVTCVDDHEVYRIRNSFGTLKFLDESDEANLILGQDGRLALGDPDGGPLATLDVAGDEYGAGSLRVGNLVAVDPEDDNNRCVYTNAEGILGTLNCGIPDEPGDDDGDITLGGSDTDWRMFDGSNNILRSIGNVGIGISDPDDVKSLLDVAGDIHIGLKTATLSHELILGTDVHDGKIRDLATCTSATGECDPDFDVENDANERYTCLDDQEEIVIDVYQNYVYQGGIYVPENRWIKAEVQCVQDSGAYSIRNQFDSLEFVDGGQYPRLVLGQDGNLTLSPESEDKGLVIGNNGILQVSSLATGAESCVKVDRDGKFYVPESCAGAEVPVDDDGDWRMFDGSNNILRSIGNVGIGISDPDDVKSLLDVAGDIHIGLKTATLSHELILGTDVHDGKIRDLATCTSATGECDPDFDVENDANERYTCLDDQEEIVIDVYQNYVYQGGIYVPENRWIKAEVQCVQDSGAYSIRNQFDSLEFVDGGQYPRLVLGQDGNLTLSPESEDKGLVIENGRLTVTKLSSGDPEVLNCVGINDQGVFVSDTCANIIAGEIIDPPPPTGDGFWAGALTGNISNLNSGNVGIGTNNPSQQLTIYDGNLFLKNREFQLPLNEERFILARSGRAEPPSGPLGPSCACDDGDAVECDNDFVKTDEDGSVCYDRWLNGQINNYPYYEEYRSYIDTTPKDHYTSPTQIMMLDFAAGRWPYAISNIGGNMTFTPGEEFIQGPALEIGQDGAVTVPALTQGCIAADNTGKLVSTGASCGGGPDSGGDDGDWTFVDLLDSPETSNIYRLAGNVGIGTQSPSEKLMVQGGNILLTNVEDESGPPMPGKVFTHNTKFGPETPPSDTCGCDDSPLIADCGDPNNSNHSFPAPLSANVGDICYDRYLDADFDDYPRSVEYEVAEFSSGDPFFTSAPQLIFSDLWTAGRTYTIVNESGTFKFISGRDPSEPRFELGSDGNLTLRSMAGKGLDVRGKVTAKDVIISTLTEAETNRCLEVDTTGKIVPTSGSCGLSESTSLWGSDNGDVFRPTGNVGIGTDNPLQKFTVKDGNILLVNREFILPARTTKFVKELSGIPKPASGELTPRCSQCDDGDNVECATEFDGSGGAGQICYDRWVNVNNYVYYDRYRSQYETGETVTHTSPSEIIMLDLSHPGWPYSMSNDEGSVKFNPGDQFIDGPALIIGQDGVVDATQKLIAGNLEARQTIKAGTLADDTATGPRCVQVNPLGILTATSNACVVNLPDAGDGDWYIDLSNHNTYTGVTGIDGLDITGNVGIGTDEPTSKLSVLGDLTLMRDPTVNEYMEGKALVLQSYDPDNITPARTDTSDPTVSSKGDDNCPGSDPENIYRCSFAGQTCRDEARLGGADGSKYVSETLTCIGGTASYAIRTDAGSLKFLNTDENLRVIIGQDGNVGIGVEEPTQKLDVNGRAVIRQGLAIGQTSFIGYKGVETDGTNDLVVQGQLLVAGGAGSAINKLGIGYAPPAQGEGTLIVSGNVGIGTTTPGQKLHVAGNIYSIGGDICIEGSKCLSNAITSQITTYWSPNTDTNGIHYDSGNVGIGTRYPEFALDVEGTVHIGMLSGQNSSHSLVFGTVGDDRRTTIADECTGVSASPCDGEDNTPVGGTDSMFSCRPTDGGPFKDIYKEYGWDEVRGEKVWLNTWGQDEITCVIDVDTYKLVNDAGTLKFITGRNDAERMEIGWDGNVTIRPNAGKGLDVLGKITANSIGIGTAPSYKLHVNENKSGYAASIINQGTSNSLGLLVRSYSTGAALVVMNTNGGKAISATGDIYSDTDVCIEDGACLSEVITSQTTTYWSPNTDTNGIHYDSGNVGIGTSDPDTKLTVQGNITLKRPDLETIDDQVGHEIIFESATQGSTLTQRDGIVDYDPAVHADSCDYNTQTPFECSASDVGDPPCQDVYNGISLKASMVTCVANTAKYAIRSKGGDLEFRNTAGVTKVALDQQGNLNIGDIDNEEHSITPSFYSLRTDADTLKFLNSSGTERVRIGEDGHVIISTTALLKGLEVKGYITTNNLRIGPTDTVYNFSLMKSANNSLLFRNGPGEFVMKLAEDKSVTLYGFSNDVGKCVKIGTNGKLEAGDCGSAAVWNNVAGGIRSDEKVGIGMDPVEKLDVVGNIHASQYIIGEMDVCTGSLGGNKCLSQTGSWTELTSSRIYFDGMQVGIGTNDPTHTLDIDGGIRIRGGDVYSDGNLRFRLEDNRYFDFQSGSDSYGIVIRGTEGGHWGNIKANANGLHFANISPIPQMTIKNGNVGIGTTDPKMKLNIADGGIFVQGDEVPATGEGIVIKYGNAGNWGSISSTEYPDNIYKELKFGASYFRFYSGSDHSLALEISSTNNVTAQGGLTVKGLAGSGDRCVEVDNSGNLKLASGACGTGSGAIGGGGQVNKIPKFSGATSLTSSIITESGGKIGIGDATPSYKLDVAGDIKAEAKIIIGDSSGLRSHSDLRIKILSGHPEKGNPEDYAAGTGYPELWFIEAGRNTGGIGNLDESIVIASERKIEFKTGPVTNDMGINSGYTRLLINDAGNVEIRENLTVNKQLNVVENINAQGGVTFNKQKVCIGIESDQEMFTTVVPNNWTKSNCREMVTKLKLAAEASAKYRYYMVGCLFKNSPYVSRSNAVAPAVPYRLLNGSQGEAPTPLNNCGW
ncbi:hypothetical protein ACFL3E_00300 [Patescibacteria group bacterium]